MKKVLMLGGSLYQTFAIKEAVRLGYYVITCDYLPNNPGHKFAHESYNVSTTDKEAVLDLARKLHVDGVVAYASDPAAPTAAYVCEELGLPTSPYKSVEILSKKDFAPSNKVSFPSNLYPLCFTIVPSISNTQVWPNGDNLSFWNSIFFILCLEVVHRLRHLGDFV